MGFFTAIKRIFTGESADEKVLDEARARHGIVVDKAEMDIQVSEEKKFVETYDPWEDIRNFRTTFFIGGWAARKIHPNVVGEDKVKKELEELQKKREEEARKHDEEAGKKTWDRWEREKGAKERKTSDKEE